MSVFSQLSLCAYLFGEKPFIVSFLKLGHWKVSFWRDMQRVLQIHQRHEKLRVHSESTFSVKVQLRDPETMFFGFKN